MLDDLVARARQEPGLPWNDLRERRLLTGALELSRRKARRRAVARRAAVGGSLLALLALVLLAVMRPHPGPGPAVAVAERMVLPGGATAEVATGAQVRVREACRERVRVLQSHGRVTYEVTRDPDRRFEVEAADVRVIVHGTRFSVTVDESWVGVAVVTGRVEVYDGLRSTMLTSGEEIRVRGYVAAPSATPSAVPAAPPPSVPAPAPPAVTPETAQSLLDLADAARRAGRSADATAALRTLVTRYPNDPRAAAAWFTLGRIESGRGNPAGAADAFAHCRRVGRGLLAEDALAEEAAATGSAVLAREYLSQYPNGTHVKRMEGIVGAAR